MKKFRWIWITIVFSTFGCSKFLEIEPKSGKIDEDAVKTVTDLKQLLNSCYDAMRSDDFLGGTLWTVQELMADNLSETNVSGTLLATYNRNTSVFNQECRRLWNTGYTIIYRANLVLKYVETIPGLSPSEKANIRGQALFMRTYCHFELVKLFAQPWGYTADNSHLGIPIRLVADKNAVPRSSVAKVYEQLFQDVNIAIQELPGNAVSGTANVWAAKALLARMYFQQGKYQFSYKFAKEVMNNGPYIFNVDCRKRFAKTGTNENVFELISTGTASPGQECGKRLKEYFQNTSGGLSFLRASDGYYNRLLVDTQDRRYQYWVKMVRHSNGGYDLNVTKLNYTDYFNIPVIHLAEMKLMVAESAAELGLLTEALIQVNDIRRRVGLAGYTTLYKNEIITEARIQRQLEMFLEGNRLQDLKRIAVNSDKSTKVRGVMWDCPGLVLAIPDDEISANPDIIQNPLGGCK